MKALNSTIALGINAATAVGLSLLNVNKDFVIGFTLMSISVATSSKCSISNPHLSSADRNSIGLKISNGLLMVIFKQFS